MHAVGVVLHILACFATSLANSLHAQASAPRASACTHSHFAADGIKQTGPCSRAANYYISQTSFIGTPKLTGHTHVYLHAPNSKHLKRMPVQSTRMRVSDARPKN